MYLLMIWSIIIDNRSTIMILLLQRPPIMLEKGWQIGQNWSWCEFINQLWNKTAHPLTHHYFRLETVIYSKIRAKKKFKYVYIYVLESPHIIHGLTKGSLNLRNVDQSRTACLPLPPSKNHHPHYSPNISQLTYS